MRLFSPVATTSVQQSGSSMFLMDDDLPPSIQLEVLPPVGTEFTSALVQTEQMLLPEVALPVPQVQLQTAYDLLRLLRQFSCTHPGVLGTATVPLLLPPVGSSSHVYQVPPPSSSWPVPKLPESALSLAGIQGDEADDYARNVYVYHLINAASSLARVEAGERNEPYAVKDISIGFGPDQMRLFVCCSDPPGAVLKTDPAAEDEGDLDSITDPDMYGSAPLNERERAHYEDLKTQYRQRRDRTRELVARLSSLQKR
jgi:hypothetical protein